MAKKTEINDNVIVFGKPYLFEGEEVVSIDLSGAENIKARDMIEANNYLARMGRLTVPVPELDLQYLLYLAHLASDKPIEFFEQLSMADAVKVKNKVRSFFSDEE